MKKQLNKTIHLMVGISGSGKSTFARTIIGAKSEPTKQRYISRDEIRFGYLQPGDDYFKYETNVVRDFHGCIRAACLDDYITDVWIDQMNISPKARREILNLITQEGTCYNCLNIEWMDTDMREAIKRDKGRVGRAQVGEKILNGMVLTEPTFAEFKQWKNNFNTIKICRNFSDGGFEHRWEGNTNEVCDE